MCIDRGGAFTKPIKCTKITCLTAVLARNQSSKCIVASSIFFAKRQWCHEAGIVYQTGGSPSLKFGMSTESTPNNSVFHLAVADMLYSPSSQTSIRTTLLPVSWCYTAETRSSGNSQIIKPADDSKLCTQVSQQPECVCLGLRWVRSKIVLYQH